MEVEFFFVFYTNLTAETQENTYGGDGWKRKAANRLFLPVPLNPNYDKLVSQHPTSTTNISPAAGTEAAKTVSKEAGPDNQPDIPLQRSSSKFQPHIIPCTL
ncbi:unnamed protein product [Allacma fusca]|uniref:Uncharacterized protein n=1 Tax=Allacma fusca TaxID=39272 RepID=A0A8J2LGD4_9HEXA|nr:unnamed protein product [Allacma fusca]